MPAQQSLPTAPPSPGTPHSAFPLRGVTCSASSLQTRSRAPCDGRRPAVLTDGDEGHEAPHARARVGAASLFSGSALWSAGRGGFCLLVIADAVGVLSVCVYRDLLECRISLPRCSRPGWSCWVTRSLLRSRHAVFHTSAHAGPLISTNSRSFLSFLTKLWLVLRV